MTSSLLAGLMVIPPTALTSAPVAAAGGCLDKLEIETPGETATVFGAVVLAPGETFTADIKHWTSHPTAATYRNSFNSEIRLSPMLDDGFPGYASPAQTDAFAADGPWQSDGFMSDGTFTYTNPSTSAVTSFVLEVSYWNRPVSDIIGRTEASGFSTCVSPHTPPDRPTRDCVAAPTLVANGANVWSEPFEMKKNAYISMRMVDERPLRYTDDGEAWPLLRNDYLIRAWLYGRSGPDDSWHYIRRDAHASENNWLRSSYVGSWDISLQNRSDYTEVVVILGKWISAGYALSTPLDVSIKDPGGSWRSTCLTSTQTTVTWDSAPSCAADLTARMQAHVTNKGGVSAGYRISLVDPATGDEVHGSHHHTIDPDTTGTVALGGIPTGTWELRLYEQQPDGTETRIGSTIRQSFGDLGCEIRPTCFGQVATVILDLGEQPTAGDDVIWGTDGPDTIDALAGSDRVCARGGNDLVYGRSGDDSIAGGDGDDTILGEEGDDTIYGQNGHDDLDGGAGADIVLGQDGNDSILGQDGDDELFGGTGSDSIVGGNQDDVLSGGPGVDVGDGSAGTDRCSAIETVSNCELQDQIDETSGDAALDEVESGEGLATTPVSSTNPDCDWIFRPLGPRNGGYSFYIDYDDPDVPDSTEVRGHLGPISASTFPYDRKRDGRDLERRTIGQGAAVYTIGVVDPYYNGNLVYEHNVYFKLTKNNGDALDDNWCEETFRVTDKPVFAPEAEKFLEDLAVDLGLPNTRVVSKWLDGPPGDFENIDLVTLNDDQLGYVEENVNSADLLELITRTDQVLRRADVPYATYLARMMPLHLIAAISNDEFADWMRDEGYTAADFGTTVNLTLSTGDLGASLFFRGSLYGAAAFAGAALAASSTSIVIEAASGDFHPVAGSQDAIELMGLFFSGSAFLGFLPGLGALGIVLSAIAFGLAVWAGVIGETDPTNISLNDKLTTVLKKEILLIDRERESLFETLARLNTALEPSCGGTVATERRFEGCRHAYNTFDDLKRPTAMFALGGIDGHVYSVHTNRDAFSQRLFGIVVEWESANFGFFYGREDSDPDDSLYDGLPRWEYSSEWTWDDPGVTWDLWFALGVPVSSLNTKIPQFPSIIDAIVDAGSRQAGKQSLLDAYCPDPDCMTV